MRCTICGAEIPDDSMYCQKCGEKILKQSITLENLRSEICELEKVEDREIKKYYDTLLNVLDLKEFKKVTYIYSPLDFSVEDMFDEEGNLNIYMMDKEDLIKLSGALVQNAVEGVREHLSSISKGQHNDRIAQVIAARELYHQALLTENQEIKSKLLGSSMASLQEGINKLKNEMKENLEMLQKLPKSTIKKLFCGISPRRAWVALEDIREAFDCYVNSVGLLIGVNASFGDRDAEKRVAYCISEEKTFLLDIKQSDGYKRLLEIDDENNSLWKHKMIVLQDAMNNMSEKIETGKITFEIERKENE